MPFQIKCRFSWRFSHLLFPNEEERPPQPHFLRRFFPPPPLGFCLRLGPVTRRKSRDEMRSRQQLTRRDETRDGLVPSVSRPKVTRRDEIRDSVNKKNFASAKKLIFCILKGLFWTETKIICRDRLARQSHETRRDRDGLVSSRLAFFRDETVSLPALV